MLIKISWNVFNNLGIMVLDRESLIFKDVSFYIFFFVFQIGEKEKKLKMKVKWGF